MKRIATMALATLFTLNSMSQQETITLHLVETSDVHGNFFPVNMLSGHQTRGSMARVASYVGNLRQKYGDDVILLDNGDILQGQPLNYYYNFVDTLSANIAAQVVNYLGYDAQTIGNHDVETGPRVYDKWISETRCPLLGANVVDVQTGKPRLQPYTIIERRGLRVAIIGLLTPAIPNWLEPELWPGLRFENMVESARKWVKVVREQEKADLVVGLFHSGWDGGIVTPDYREDDTKRVAELVDGFDVIFFGHDHTPHCSRAGNNVLCLDPANNAMQVAEATVEVVRNNGVVVGKNVSGTITDISAMPVDSAFMSHFASHLSDVKGWASQPIGYFANDIYVRDAFFGPSPFIDFIHNIQLKLTGADVSFNAPLSFNGAVKAGKVTVADMFNLYKYENKLYVMRLKGSEIRKHLEMSYDLWVQTMSSPDDHLLRLNNLSADDSQRMGFSNLLFNFDSAAGIDYEVDVTQPDGHKVRILRMSNGKPFSEDAWYNVAVNSYRGNGGGELLTKGAGIERDSLRSRVVWQSERDQRYYLTEEIRKLGNVAPTANSNWRFVPEEWTKPAAQRDRELLFGSH